MGNPEEVMPEYRYQVKTAFGWHIAAELMRRHFDSIPLRLLLGHPYGGGVRQLWIAVDNTNLEPGSSFYDFRLGFSFSDGRAHREYNSDPDAYPFVKRMLETEDLLSVVNDLELKANLPKFIGTIPASKPPVVVTRVIAGVMARCLLSRQNVEAECGWDDRVGQLFGAPCLRLETIPWINEQVPWGAKDWETLAKATTKYWFLGPVHGNSQVAKVVVSMDGRCAHVDAPSQVSNLWEIFQSNGRRIGPLVDHVLDLMK